MATINRHHSLDKDIYLLDKLQRQIYRTFGASLAALLESMAQRRNVASFKSSIGISLVDVHLNWFKWFHFPVLEVGLLGILTDCMIFLSPFQNGLQALQTSGIYS